MSSNNEIRSELSYIDEQLREVDATYTRDNKALREKRQIVQSKCPHDQGWKRWPDASGNNGSWDECNICGVEQ